MPENTFSISVIICTYSEQRWKELVTAVESVQRQSRPVRDLIVVVDHNPTLFARAQQYFSEQPRSALGGTPPPVTLIENQEVQGISGARNSGMAVAGGEIFAFLDDDAIASANWLETLMVGYVNPAVLGVGGAIEPLWMAPPYANRPRWFPEEFDWVVGCTYRGMPKQPASIRNLIGANMSLRRQVYEQLGGFHQDVGQVGSSMLRCDDTEYCIRIHQRWPSKYFWYIPEAKVYHHVPGSRANWRYFCNRCFTEGLAKAQIVHLLGMSDGLEAERKHTLQTLPKGIWRELGDAFRLDMGGLQRASAILIGFLLATLGYLKGRSASRSANEPPARFFEPTRLIEVELSQAIPSLPPLNLAQGHLSASLLALVRLHGVVLGMLPFRLSKDGMTAEAYAHQIWSALREPILLHCAIDGLPALDRLPTAGISISYPMTASTLIPTPCLQEYAQTLQHAPLISVVIATRDRTQQLEAALDSLLAMDYPAFEIIVVDNAPKSNATAELMQQKYEGGRMKDEGTSAFRLHPVRYLREETPGLAVAHNRALQEVQSEIVAFTDDDVLVDRQWLTRIAQAFESAGNGGNVGCVTGMILPAEMVTAAQAWIEQFGGFSKGFQRQIFDRDTPRSGNPLHPYAAGRFGSGANMSFRSAALRAIGGFDPALGAGSLALGGDDLAAFFQIIDQGYTLVYEPSALVYHFHRRDYAGLRRQAYGYGVGLTAYLTKLLIEQPWRLFDFLRKAPDGFRHLFAANSSKNAKKQVDYPKELTWIERKGMLYGPLAYLRSRRVVKPHLRYQ